MNTTNTFAMPTTENIIKNLYEKIGETLVEFDTEYCPIRELCPHLTIDEKKKRVVSVFIQKWGDDLYLCLKLHDFEDMKWQMLNLNMEKVKQLDEDELWYVLHEMYYETDISIEIGDWQDDFMPLCV